MCMCERSPGCYQEGTVQQHPITKCSGVTWSAPTARKWCANSNSQANTGYNAASGGGVSGWANDPNSGWRLCGKSVDECKKLCQDMGVDNNGKPWCQVCTLHTVITIHTYIHTYAWQYDFFWFFVRFSFVNLSVGSKIGCTSENSQHE